MAKNRLGQGSTRCLPSCECGRHQSHPISAETRAKISKALKGRKLPAAHRDKMCKGRPKGFKHSEETKDKIGAAHRGVPETYRAKFMNALGLASHHRSQLMDAVEQAFYDGLVTMYGDGEVLREVPFGPYIVDFYVQKLHLAYELDGWQHERLYLDGDKQRDAWLLEFAGLPVSRVRRQEVDVAMEAA